MKKKNDNNKSPREIVEDWIASGETAGSVANYLGISSAALSQWRKGNYPGNTASIDQAVMRLCNDRTLGRGRIKLPGRPPFFETTISRVVSTSFRLAQQTGGLHMILGGAGLGKSTSARYLVENTNLAWMVEITPSTASSRSVLLEICRGMGISPSSRDQATLEREIIRKARTNHCALVMDEAQHLSVKVLYELYGIANKCTVDGRQRLGILLLGNEQVYTTVEKGFDQLSSRIKTTHRLNTMLSRADAWSGAQAWSEHLGGLDDEMVNYLANLATAPGGYRNVEVVVEGAYVWAGGSREPLSLKHFENAWKLSGRNIKIKGGKKS